MLATPAHVPCSELKTAANALRRSSYAASGWRCLANARAIQGKRKCSRRPRVAI